ncbi:MAG TPA: phosphotransferase [Chryseolinea sp.]|nr:phosphotransferase [Chryseolinea sp.]
MTFSFPATETTLSAVHLAKLLQEQYKLDIQTSCKLFRTGMNHLYLVTDGGDKYVLRIYTHNWRTKLEVSEELRLLRYLQSNGIPVSYPMPDRNGEFVLEINALEGIRYATLLSYAEGKKVPKFNAQASHTIGVTMAMIHKLTENFQVRRTTYDLKTLVEDSLKRTQSIFSPNIDEMKFVAMLKEYLTLEYKKVNLKSLRTGVVHMDIWFDNLHFDNDDGITLFDFDFCGNGWLCLDIAYFMFQLYNTNLDEVEFKHKAEAFLSGYESIQQISEEEKRILPMAGLCVFLFYLGVQCDRFDTWSNIFLNEDHLRRFTGFLKRWMGYNNIQIN